MSDDATFDHMSSGRQRRRPVDQPPHAGSLSRRRSVHPTARRSEQPVPRPVIVYRAAMTDAAPCTARLILPRRSLASCVRAYVIRDTTGLPALPPEQRFNHFPATTLCSLNWFIEGQVQLLLEDPATLSPPLGQTLFRGPQTRPTISHNPGPVRAFKLLLFPQALHALTGMHIAPFVDRIVPLASALDEAWLALAEAVLQSDNDETRVALIENFLEPRWNAVRAAGRAPGGSV
ncbi:MAG TPA: hypothetical protein VFY22_11800, partial [Hydrogenophaga sp.]|nr:hypothetical protein [Hydrogenophaga sp.]